MDPEDILYGNTGNFIEGPDPSLDTGNSAFSFTSDGNNPGQLYDLKLSLTDNTPNDGGSVNIILRADDGTAPGRPLYFLGSIADSNLNNLDINNEQSDIVDFKPDGVFLNPHTRYWVFVQGSNSKATLNTSMGLQGTGDIYDEYTESTTPPNGFESGVYPNHYPAPFDNFGFPYIAQVTEIPAFTLDCYVAGTKIKTIQGPVAIELLQIGDIIVTAASALRPIKWLGHRKIDCRSHPRRSEILPIRVAAHAFGANKPARDLYVSPGHSICVDACGEVLIPAGSLVNGTTIVQVKVETVTYWHIELDSHDIIIADNLPTESYLEMGNRAFFAGGGVLDIKAVPDAKGQRTHADFCRPYHATGALVDAVRSRLAARAGVLAQEAPVTSRQMA